MRETETNVTLEARARKALASRVTFARRAEKAVADRPLVVGKGTKWEVRPGVWQYRHNLGKDPETGKYLYSPKRTIYTTKKREVDAALEAYKIELNTGIFVQKSPDTVGEYARRFHENREGTISPLAYKREKVDVDHIEMVFGKVKLQQLRPFMIEEAYAKIRKDKLFSESEIHKIHAKLTQVLEHAVDNDLIAKNPCAKIKVPRPECKEREALSAEEASRLLGILLSLKPDAHITATLLMLDTGVRRGEALGLTWENTNLDEGTVFIKQQFAKDKEIRGPKSRKSVRLLSISPVAVEYLRAWKAEQAKELKKVGMAQTDGTPLAHSLSPLRKKEEALSTGLPRVGVTFMDPDHYNRWFRDFCVKNGFGKYERVSTYRDKEGRKRYRRSGYRGLTPHMLRHTQATLLIGSNVDIKTVQTRLGHSTASLTLDVYSHAVRANDRSASDVISGLLSGPTEQEPSTNVSEPGEL